MSVRTISIKHTTKVAIVDEIDFEHLSRFTWRLLDGTVCRNDTIGTRRFISMASQIHGTYKQMYDHIDRDKLNNQRSNLRLCDRSQNGANRVKWKVGTSKYKGVHWLKRNKKWAASIRVNYKPIYLGLFNDEKDAALAYNVAAQKHFGEFAHLNTFELSPTMVEGELEKRQ